VTIISSVGTLEVVFASAIFLDTRVGLGESEVFPTLVVSKVSRTCMPTHGFKQWRKEKEEEEDAPEGRTK
jgi:hypothetical protein